jgi:TP901 family phage tail tape measure protein
MAKFAIEANKAAKNLSTTTTAYTDAALIYYQQGNTEKLAKKKADITIKASNVAGTGAKEMSEYLTAVWNSYKVTEDELEKYVDVMTAVGAATASSTEEISEAMEKVASVGEATGIKFEQLASIISTVSSVTRQSASTVGTAFKTIFARMADLELEGSIDEGGVSVTLG